MSQLQKKCFVFSAGTHLLLLAVFFLGTAFFNARHKEQPAVPVDLLNAKIVEDALARGGSRGPESTPSVATPTPTPPTPPTQVEVVTPPTPTPPTPPKETVVEPPAKVEVPKKIETIPIEKSVPKKTETKVEPAKTVEKTASSKIKVNTSKTVTRNSADTAKVKAAADKTARDREIARLAAAGAKINNSLTALKGNLSQGVSIGTPGAGGEGFVNYGQYVIAVYQNAWLTPNDLADDSLIVQVTVTIARDGTVLRASVTRKAGVTALDKSVQRALDRVQSIGRPFPEGIRDAQRTFQLDFNLKAKRQIG